MRTRSTLAVALTAAALVARPAAAAEHPMGSAAKPAPAPSQKEIAAQRAEMQTLAHKMMGHITLAAVALDLGLTEEARTHVETADGLAAQLAREAPGLRTETQLDYGKISYAVGGRSKDYYVPIMDDLFLLSDYDTTFHVWKDRTDVEETDAGVGRITIDADVREVQKALGRARAQIDAGQSAAAADSLAGIFRDAVVEETVIGEPLWAVHDNLALARNLVREGQYGAARYALGHARKSLALLEKQPASDQASASFEKMDHEIGVLEGELASKDPSLAARADARLYTWMNTVRSWF